MPGGNVTPLRMCCPPKLVACMPEIIVVLAGAQTGALDQHVLYRNDRSASRSMFGVSAYSSP